jgi:hypothetical protein
MGAVGVDMASLKRDSRPRNSDLYPCHVGQKRQLKEPSPSAGPRHLLTPDKEAQMSAAISTASNSRCLAKGATLLEAPARAEYQLWRPVSHRGFSEMLPNNRAGAIFWAR